MKKRASSPGKRRPGRPKGRKNTPNTAVTFTPALTRIAGLLGALLQRIAGVVSLTYVVLEGHCGHHNALAMAPPQHLHLISKLRYDAALYFPSTGPYAGRGPRRQYGRKVDDTALPDQSRTATSVDGHIRTCLDQAQLLHKEFAHPLNIVVVVKTNLRTQAQAHAVLFSSDLPWAAASLVDDDS